MLDKGDVGVFQIITYCVCNTKLDWNTIEGKQKKKKKNSEEYESISLYCKLWKSKVPVKIGPF